MPSFASGGERSASVDPVGDRTRHGACRTGEEVIGRFDDVERRCGPRRQIDRFGRRELIVTRDDEVLGSRVAPGQHLATGDGWGDREPAVDARLDHRQRHQGAERIAAHPDAFVDDAGEEVDGRSDVESLGIAVVVQVVAAGRATKVEAQRMESSAGQLLVESGHDRMETVAPVQRMRVSDRHGAAHGGSFGRGEVGFEVETVDGREGHRVDGHGPTVP